MFWLFVFLVFMVILKCKYFLVFLKFLSKDNIDKCFVFLIFLDIKN